MVSAWAGRSAWADIAPTHARQGVQQARQLLSDSLRGGGSRTPTARPSSAQRLRRVGSAASIGQGVRPKSRADLEKRAAEVAAAARRTRRTSLPGSLGHLAQKVEAAQVDVAEVLHSARRASGVKASGKGASFRAGLLTQIFSPRDGGSVSGSDGGSVGFGVDSPPRQSRSRGDAGSSRGSPGTTTPRRRGRTTTRSGDKDGQASGSLSHRPRPPRSGSASAASPRKSPRPAAKRADSGEQKVATRGAALAHPGRPPLPGESSARGVRRSGSRRGLADALR